MKHDPRTSNVATGYMGHLVGPEVPEEEHYYRCAHCGQAVDMRDLGQVFHHEKPKHEKLRES